MYIFVWIHAFMCDKYMCIYICIRVRISRTFMSWTSTHLYWCKCNQILQHTHIRTHVPWQTCVIQTHEFWAHRMMPKSAKPARKVAIRCASTSQKQIAATYAPGGPAGPLTSLLFWFSFFFSCKTEAKVNPRFFFGLFCHHTASAPLQQERSLVVCSKREARKRPARRHSRHGPWN